MTDVESTHPSDDALRALSLGELDEADMAHISGHLDECATCCERIDGMADDDDLMVRLKEGAASQEAELVNRTQRRAAVRVMNRRSEPSSAARKEDSDTPRGLVPAPRQIGEYDLLSEVGRGGMGVVYKARHRGLNRLAALKMILTGEFASPTQELRFRLEAQLAARVRHPNIVQVYEIGSYEGRPFLAMEWFEGGSLANRLDGKPWSPRDAAALLETLARAIDVAHCEGVVHRDLKPANILLAVTGGGRTAERGGWRVDEEDGDRELPGAGGLAGGHESRASVSTHHTTLSTLHPKITDFGLAQPIEGGQTMTQSGILVGTPGYMAPEQAAGKRALVGPATDIYALGVVLYQLLTGQLPFRHESTLELLRAVTSDEPTPLRRLHPRVPRDLEAITLHCLEKEPGARYPSALALAEDLRRFQEGKQVLARPVGAAARLVRACRRRPVITGLLGLLAISLLGGASGITWKWLEANDQRDLANANASQANKEKQVALYQAYRASLAAANSSLQNDDVADAASLLKLAPEALRGWEWRHLSGRLDDSSAVVPWPPGGGYLIAAPDQLSVGALSGAVLRITDLDGVEQRTVPVELKHRRGISVTQTERGVRVAAWFDDTAFDLLDEAGRVLCRVAVPENKGHDPARVVASPDGTRLACDCPDGHPDRIAVFDATSGKRTAVCLGHQARIWSITFSPDNARVATSSEDHTARLWDAATGRLLVTFQGHGGPVYSVAFSPDGARLVTASGDGTVRQWDARTGHEIERSYDRHHADVHTAVYSPDGQWVASSGKDRTIRVWRAQDLQDVAVLHGHTHYVFGVAFTADGRRLASVSSGDDNAASADWLRVWDVAPDATLPILRGHTAAIYPMAYSPDGRWLASGSWDRTVRVWDAATGERCATLLHDRRVEGLAFGPDGTWLLTACNEDERLRVWDVATARLRKEIPCSLDFSVAVTVSLDGTRAAVEDFNWYINTQRLRVIDLAAGTSLFTTKAVSLAYSPDGRWLAAAGEDAKTVLLLDARTYETTARFSGHEKTVTKAAFSPDGRYLASCSEDRTVRVWQIDSGECRVLRGHTDIVYAVAFHPDGTRLATAARDGAIWLWDLARGEDLVRLRGHDQFVWSLAFSPDGTTLASCSGDETVRLWDTAPLKTRHQARREADALRPEAERMVAQSLREKNDLVKVAEWLRADRGLNEPLRHAALRAVQRRAQLSPAPRNVQARP